MGALYTPTRACVQLGERRISARVMAGGSRRVLITAQSFTMLLVPPMSAPIHCNTTGGNTDA